MKTLILLIALAAPLAALDLLGTWETQTRLSQVEGTTLVTIRKDLRGGPGYADGVPLRRLLRSHHGASLGGGGRGFAPAAEVRLPGADLPA